MIAGTLALAYGGNSLHAPIPLERHLALDNQVASERQLRAKAEAKAEEEAGSRGAWQLASLGLAVITVLAFVGGTAIGSRGKRHADAAP